MQVRRLWGEGGEAKLPLFPCRLYVSSPWHFFSKVTSKIIRAKKVQLAPV